MSGVVARCKLFGQTAARGAAVWPMIMVINRKAFQRLSLIVKTDNGLLKIRSSLFKAGAKTSLKGIK